MAEILFNTGNSAIDGKITTNVTSSGKDYTITAEVWMRRNNSWKGNSNGTLHAKCYINDFTTPVLDVTKHCDVPNKMTHEGTWYPNGSWVKLLDFSKKITYDVTEDATYSVGFWSIGVGTAPDAFIVNKYLNGGTEKSDKDLPFKATTDSSGNALTVITPPSQSTLTTRSLFNHCTVKVTPGSSGVGNASNGCETQFTIMAKEDPTLLYREGSFTENFYDMSLPALIGKDYFGGDPVDEYTIFIRTRTKGALGVHSDWKESYITPVYYYRPPTGLTGLKVDTKFNTQSNKYTYTCEWDASSSQCNLDDLVKYHVEVYRNGELFPIETEPDISGTQLILDDPQFRSGDEIEIKVTPFSNFYNHFMGYNPMGHIYYSLPGAPEDNFVLEGQSASVKLQIKRGPLVMVKTSNKWETCPIFINDDGVWKEPESCFVYTGEGENKWKKLVQ